MHKKENIKIDELISMYKQGKITLWKAADILDISLREMIEILEKKGVEMQVGRTS